MLFTGLQMVILIFVLILGFLFIFIPLVRFLCRAIFKRNIENYKALKTAKWRLNEVTYDNGIEYFYPQVKYLGMWWYITFGGNLRLLYKRGHCQCENTKKKAWELQEHLEARIRNNSDNRWSRKEQHLYKKEK